MPHPQVGNAIQGEAGIRFSYKSSRHLDFVGFVPDHYVEEGLDELSIEKLSSLLRLCYNAIADATADLGSPEQIRETFAWFQKCLYTD